MGVVSKPVATAGSPGDLPSEEEDESSEEEEEEEVAVS